MNRRVLGALTLALLGLALLLRWDRGPDSTTSSPLLGLSPQEVQALSWTVDGQTVSLTRDDGGWRFSSPLKGRADPFAVDGLVRSLTELAGSPQANANSQGDYGWSVALRIDTGDGQQSLEFGQVAPVSGKRYARLGARGDGVWMVDDLPRTLLHSDFLPLVDRSLMSLGAGSITRIHLEEEGQAPRTWELDGATWYLHDGEQEKVRVGWEAMWDWLNALDSGRAQKVLPLDGVEPAEHGRLILTGGSQGEETLLLSTSIGGNPSLVRAGDGYAFLAGRWLWEAARRPLEQWRCKAPLDLDPTTVQSVQIGAFELRPDPQGGYSGTGLDGTPLHFDTEGLLRMLQRLSAATGPTALWDSDSEPLLFEAGTSRGVVKGQLQQQEAVWVARRGGEDQARLLEGVDLSTLLGATP